MSRKSAFATLSMDEYRESMKEVFSTCVVRDTLDESPMAYRDAGEIIDRIEPIYNFKASE
ncbi:MAG: hypothetical protein FWG71_10015 [Synergistaceae bacterium]|nr:hypothetical protein [Synergistaceae bacterium]